MIKEPEKMEKMNGEALSFSSSGAAIWDRRLFCCGYLGVTVAYCTTQNRDCTILSDSND